MKPSDLELRYRLLHGADTEAARAELERLRDGDRPVFVVSACLLGVRCRYDGEDKRDDAAVAQAVGDAAILPLCPEVLARLGVPRPPVTLSADGKRCLTREGHDVTTEFDAGARLGDLFAREANAIGALLKERSPSCGVTEVHGPDGLQPGQGRFAARLSGRGLPIVSDEALDR